MEAKDLKNINKQWQEIENNLNFLEENFPSLKSHINSLGKGLNAVALSFQRVHDGIEKRQFLIDLQCNFNIFDGPIHEEYHLVTAQLDVEFDIYLSSIKTALNRLPSLIFETLKHEDRRELRTKSFGAFINSITDKEFDSAHLTKIKNILIKQGGEIDRTINDYRDKNIEHIKNPSIKYGLASDKRGVRRHHQRIDASMKSDEDIREFKKRVESVPKENRGTALRLQREDGEYVYHVHVTGSRRGLVERGDVLGFPSDGNSGHFKQYGTHVHIFASLNLPLEEITSQEGFFSPTAFDSMISLTEFLNFLVQSIVEVVRKWDTPKSR